MHPNQNPEQELDDILLEFSSPSLEEILKEFSLPALQETEEAGEAEESEVPAAMEPLEADATAVFTPVQAESEPEDEAPAPVATAAPAQEKAEPFSDEWEPEYEEPMGEFIPKAPIPFPEKSRLRQLRQKLVAGPERRYQALSEVGLFQLQFGMLLNFLLAVISVAATVAYSLGFIDPTRLRTVVFCQLLLAMLSALIGCYRLLEGISNLFRGRFTLDAALFITFLACVGDGLLCLSQQRLSASSLFCLQLFMSQCAAYHRRNTELSQMDILRKANELTAVVKVDDIWENRPGFQAVDGEPESFLDHYKRPSAPERALSIYAVLSLLAAAGIAVATYFLVDLNTAIQVFMAAQLIALPFTAFISVSRPTAILQNRLHSLGAVLCGWQGIRAVPRRSLYPLDHADLFPDGSIKMNSVKFYGSVDPGRVVSYTTAMLTEERSGLLRVFRLLPRSRGSSAHTVSNFQNVKGGIRGDVDGADVLIGTAECMQSNGIYISQAQQVPQGIYTAVDREFCGAFDITYSRSKFTTLGIRTLCTDRHIRPVVVACDFVLTPKYLRGKLAVNPRRITFPERDDRLKVMDSTPSEDATVVALTTKQGLAPKTYSLTGARALKGAWKAGAIIHILGGAIGLAAVGVLALNGGLALLNPVNLLLYSTIWSLPGLLITEFTRHL
jgi:hypothetical protein